MLRETLHRLNTRAIDPRDLMAEAQEKAGAPAAAGVFIRRYEDAAPAADGGYAGVPITIKDNFDVAGETTLAGSKVLAGAQPAAKDASVVSRLRRVGFTILGRTNMTEFAFAAIGTNPHYGTPHNPAFTGDPHIPGGSSSGAAVSVALGIAPVAIGSDTGGSVRIPAALCGITGFKPTFGAITLEGVYPLSTSLDSVGVLAHTVADCAAVFDVVRDAPGVRGPRPLHGVRIAVIENYVRNALDDTVATAFDAACAKLADAGADIVPLRLPELEEIPVLHRKGTIVMAEAFTQLREVITGREADCDPRIVTRILAGGAITPAELEAIKRRRMELQAAVAARLEGCDAYLMPTVAITAPTIAAVGAAEAYLATNGLILRNASVVNFLAGCAVSVPCHPADGAPVGLSVAMVGGRDDALLSLAESIEGALRS
jgi:aspartyl-tRNA(Asn)/glutamyl-tRNA(Gln) amidotransferase subunit A